MCINTMVMLFFLYGKWDKTLDLIGGKFTFHPNSVHAVWQQKSPSADVNPVELLEMVR